MYDSTEFAEKVNDFINEVIAFGKSKNTRFTTAEEIAQQAVIILTIEALCLQNNTLISIKHLLTPEQIKDIDTLIEKNNGMKAKLYGDVLPL